MLNLLYKLTPLILVITWMTHETDGLRCYKCFGLDCPESNKFCEQVKSFVLEQLPDIYYNYEYIVPQCPNPNDENSEVKWNDVRQSSRAICGEESSGEATCVLGRFRIVTFVVDLNKNITSHGTATGCARRKLLSYIKIATLKQKCSMVRATSKIKLGLQHFLEIEHCSTYSEMCSEDWCVSPARTVIKPFLTSKTQTDNSYTFFHAGLITVLVVGALVALCTLLGMKYDTVRLRNSK